MPPRWPSAVRPRPFPRSRHGQPHRCGPGPAPGPRQPAVRSVLVAKAAFEPDGGLAGAELIDLRSRYSAVVGMFQPFRGAVQQFGLAPAKRSGPCRVDRSPDAVAIRDQQEVLRHVPDPVALPGLFLDALRQRRIQLGELIRKLAESLFALSKRLLRHHLLGDIAVRADQAYGSSVLVALDRGFDRDPPRLAVARANNAVLRGIDRKSTRLNSSHANI